MTGWRIRKQLFLPQIQGRALAFWSQEITAFVYLVLETFLEDIATRRDKKMEAFSKNKESSWNEQDIHDVLLLVRCAGVCMPLIMVDHLDGVQDDIFYHSTRLKYLLSSFGKASRQIRSFIYILAQVGHHESFMKSLFSQSFH